MKKFATMGLCLALVGMLVGCGEKPAPAELPEKIETETAVEEAIAEEAVAEAATAEETEEVLAETEDAAQSEKISSYMSILDGTWQTASMFCLDDGTAQPEHCVQFTDDEICYGHMENEQFVVEYIDQIAEFNETYAGDLQIKALTSQGRHYTYQISLSEPDMLDYFETWTEEEFDDSYRGGASLSKME